MFVYWKLRGYPHIKFGKVDKNNIIDKLGRNKYLILAGPPGINKTALLNQVKESYSTRSTLRWHCSLP